MHTTTQQAGHLRALAEGFAAELACCADPDAVCAYLALHQPSTVAAYDHVDGDRVNRRLSARWERGGCTVQVAVAPDGCGSVQVSDDCSVHHRSVLLPDGSFAALHRTYLPKQAV